MEKTIKAVGVVAVVAAFFVMIARLGLIDPTVLPPNLQPQAAEKSAIEESERQWAIRAINAHKGVEWNVNMSALVQLMGGAQPPSGAEYTIWLVNTDSTNALGANGCISEEADHFEIYIDVSTRTAGVDLDTPLAYCVILSRIKIETRKQGVAEDISPEAYEGIKSNAWKEAEVIASQVDVVIRQR